MEFTEAGDVKHARLMAILEYWGENGITDPTIRIPTDESELTWYRRACTVLDPLLKDSRLTMLE